jgi:hypothetical protein
MRHNTLRKTGRAFSGLAIAGIALPGWEARLLYEADAKVNDLVEAEAPANEIVYLESYRDQTIALLGTTVAGIAVAGAA